MMFGVIDREIEHFPKRQFSEQRMWQDENVHLSFITFFDLRTQL